MVQNRSLLKRISDRAKQMADQESAAHGNLLKPPGATGDGTPLPMADPNFNIFYDAGTDRGHLREDDERVRGRRLLARGGEPDAGRLCGGMGSRRIGFAVPVLSNAPDVKAELRIAPDVRVIAPIIIGVPVEDELEASRNRWLC